MKVIKRYTAIQLYTTTNDDVVDVKLSYGEIEGPYYDRTTPEQIFDTEEEAIEYAYRYCKYSRWIIVPVIDFEG